MKTQLAPSPATGPLVAATGNDALFFAAWQARGYGTAQWSEQLFDDDVDDGFDEWRDLYWRKLHSKQQRPDGYHWRSSQSDPHGAGLGGKTSSRGASPDSAHRPTAGATGGGTRRPQQDAVKAVPPPKPEKPDPHAWEKYESAWAKWSGTTRSASHRLVHP